MRYLEFDPAIPLALWATLAVVAAAAVLGYAWASRGRLPPGRRRGVVGLMSACAALPLLILLNPTWIERIPPPAGKPLLTVLLDASASMATRDILPDAAASPGERSTTARSRYDAGRELAGRIAKSLDDRFEVEFRTFATKTQLSSLDGLARIKPDGEATDLAAALDESLVNDRPQGQAILLLSDGVQNAGPTSTVRDAVARVKAASVPVFTRTLGGSSGVRDIEVTLPSPQELAFVGQKIPLRVAVRQRGALVRNTLATLRLDGRRIEERKIELPADGTTQVEFQVSQAKVGLYRYEASVPADPNEVTDVNNTATLLLRVVDEPVHVLLLEGKPYWDTKFLIRTLSGDSSIALTTIVRIAPGRILEREIDSVGASAAGSANRTAAKPASEPRAGHAESAGVDSTRDEKSEPEPTVARSERWSIQTDAGQLLADPATLAKYQIILLGRDAEVFLSDDAIVQLRRWLNAGDGSLVCFRGAPATQVGDRLAGLLPVRWTPERESRFRVRLTASGHDLHWLPLAGHGDDDPLSKLPSLATVSRPASRPALTTVLATTADARQPADEDPVVSYQPVGLGRVVVLEGAGMWRWAFLPQAYRQLDDVYGTLWRSLTRWLVASSGLLPSQKLALRTDQVTFSAGDPVSATLLLRENQWKGEVPKIELTREAPASPPRAAEAAAHQNSPAEKWPRVVAPLPSGDSPGQFNVPFGKLAEGRYQAHVIGVDEPTARIAFDVRDNLRERLDVDAQPDLMRYIADESGGAVLAGGPDDGRGDDLVRKFDEHLANSRPERTLRIPAWDRGWALAAIVMIWGLCWGVRRRSGLV